MLTLLRNQCNHGCAFQIVGRGKISTRLYLLLSVLPSLLLECMRTVVISQKHVQVLIVNKSAHTHTHTPHLWHLFAKALSGKEHHSLARLSLWIFVFWQCRNSSKQVIIIPIIISTVTSFQGNWLRITFLDEGNYIKGTVVTQEDAIQFHSNSLISRAFIKYSLHNLH